jgi:small subunit ribosomal protein S6
LSVKRMYEAMFLFDPTAGNNWDQVQEVVGRLMERSEGELVHLKKWDERRLAYEVEGRKRGVYVLAFFMAPTEKIVDLERDIRLSEEIIRVLVISRPKYSVEKAKEVAETSEAYVAPPHHDYGDESYEDRGRRRRPAPPVETEEVAVDAAGDDELNDNQPTS